MRIINSNHQTKTEKLKVLFPKIGTTQKIDYVMKKTGVATKESLRSILSYIKKHFGIVLNIKKELIMRMK